MHPMMEVQHHHHNFNYAIPDVLDLSVREKHRSPSPDASFSPPPSSPPRYPHAVPSPKQEQSYSTFVSPPEERQITAVTYSSGFVSGHIPEPKVPVVFSPTICYSSAETRPSGLSPRLEGKIVPPYPPTGHFLAHSPRESLVFPPSPPADVKPVAPLHPVESTPMLSYPSVVAPEAYPLLQPRGTKPTRPFKAYPKDPLALAVGVQSTESILGQSSNEAYAQFRRSVMEQVKAASTKCRTAVKRPASPCQQPQPPETQPEVAASEPSATLSISNGKEVKDAAYWERRRKNNEAAKRSRDARRAKEDEIAIRAAFLEQENLKLRFELAALKNETAKLKCLIYNH